MAHLVNNRQNLVRRNPNIIKDLHTYTTFAGQAQSKTVHVWKQGALSSPNLWTESLGTADCQRGTKDEDEDEDEVLVAL